MVWHLHQFNSFYIDDLGEIPHLSSIFNNNNKIVINDLYSYIPNMSIKHNRWLPLDVMVFQSIPCMRSMWKWPLGNLLYVLNNRSGLSSFFYVLCRWFCCCFSFCNLRNMNKAQIKTEQMSCWPKWMNNWWQCSSLETSTPTQ